MTPYELMRTAEKRKLTADALRSQHGQYIDPSQKMPPYMTAGGVMAEPPDMTFGGDAVLGMMPAAGIAKNVGGKAAAIAKERWKAKPSKTFDMEGLDDWHKFPDVPQEGMERYIPARGTPKALEKTSTPANKKRIAKALEDGIEKGGLAWYNLRPLMDEYIAKFGDKEGVKRFKQFTDLVAATSPRSNVKANIKRASMMQKLLADGVDVSKVLNTTEAGAGARMPPGYGHLAHKNHRGILGDALSEKGIQGKPLGRPKVSSFTENLRGNLEPVTVDTHNKKLLTLPYNLPETVAKTEYGFLEGMNKDMAKRHGIAPAQAQSATWVGGSNITGVDDARPFMELMDERVGATAKELGISEKKALDMFLGGKTALYGTGAGSAMIGERLLRDEQR
jgi:hypothetical protein